MQSKEAEDICREEDYENIWRVLREISEHPEIKKLELDDSVLAILRYKIK